MCDPLSIATAALTIGSSGMQFQQQREQAKFAQRAATIERNANLANLEYEQSQAAMDQAQALEQTRRDAEARMATARVAASDAGVTGVSVDSVLAELSGRAAENVQALETNYARSGVAAANERTNINQRYAATRNANPRPSGLALGLEIGGAVAGGYASNRKRMT